MQGVVRTRVGYSGGEKINPTYYNLGDHSETIQIDYDPEQISYSDLLSIFWDSHSPLSPQWSQQYKNVIFFHSDAQKRLAMISRDRMEAKLKAKVTTEIAPSTEFYLAETYHQKYYLQQVHQLANGFREIYPDDKDFIDSTAVARVNGYLGGNGSQSALEKEIDKYGLSSSGRRILLETFKINRN